MSRVIGLFAKEPVAGRVKTRLAAETSPTFAVRVAEACLLDLVDRLDGVGDERWLVFDPAAARAYFERIHRGRYHLRPQCGGDLGQRLADFTRFIFAQPTATTARRLILLGSDSPTVPISSIETAFDQLDRSDVVLGPATDGGVYLIGLSGPWTELFVPVPWGTSQVLERLSENAERSGRTLSLLQPWYDIDSRAGWSFLRGHLLATLRAGGQVDLPHLMHLIQSSKLSR